MTPRSPAILPNPISFSRGTWSLRPDCGEQSRTITECPWSWKLRSWYEGIQPKGGAGESPAFISKIYQSLFDNRQNLSIVFIYQSIRFCCKKLIGSFVENSALILAPARINFGAETRKGEFGVILGKAPRQTPAFLPLDHEWNLRGKGDPSTYHKRERAAGMSRGNT